MANSKLTSTLTCGAAVIQLLEAYGVDTIFGIPGVHTLGYYRALGNSQIKHVLTRHEQGAGFMADGYARSTGKPGVCLVITGPGVLNATTPLGQAYADSIPMLMLSSVTPSDSLGKGWGLLHEVTDQAAVTAPLTAFTSIVRHANDIPDLLARAFALFASGRPRPVHISIPTDILNGPAPDNWQVRQTPTRPGPDLDAIEAAADLLIGADRPVIMLGGGAIDAADQIQTLVKQLGAAVIPSNAAKGIIPSEHPLNLDTTISFAPTYDYLSKADVVLAIGTELAETDSYVGNLPFNGALIRIDLDPNKINDYYPATIGIVSDATKAVAALIERLPQNEAPATETIKAVDAAKAAIEDSHDELSRRHVALLRSMRRMVPDNTQIVGDMTQIVYTATGTLDIRQPRTWLHPASFCTLGCAMPMAIGAKLGAPDRPTIVLAGDGGFQFTLPELSVAIEQQLSIPILLWNNNGYAQIKQGMVRRDMPVLGVDMHNPDFVALAKAYGAKGVRPTSLAEFENAIVKALSAGGPTIIDIEQDAEWVIAAGRAL